jgi:hypothetical protein
VPVGGGGGRPTARGAPAATERLARPTRIPTPTATASVTSGRRWSPPPGRIGSFALRLGDQKRKKVTEITDGVTLPRISLMERYTPLAKKEIRHDLGFGQHGHPALHNCQYAVCAVVHIRSGVRRCPRAAHNVGMMLRFDIGRKKYGLQRKDRVQLLGIH